MKPTITSVYFFLFFIFILFHCYFIYLFIHFYFILTEENNEETEENNEETEDSFLSFEVGDRTYERDFKGALLAVVNCMLLLICR
jgi:hypothetical protein